ncbi:hypothetical protein DMENIID0001_008880 [Sergentomyia squamirostris]
MNCGDKRNSSHNCPTTEFKLPDIDDTPASEDEIEGDLHDPVDVYHLLSNEVRQQYLKYLEKLLHSNYETWMLCNPYEDYGQLNLEEMHQCAKILEQKAVKSCMVVNLYRKTMIKIISDIRRDTKNESLSTRLIHCHKKVREKCVNASTQTEQESFLISRYFQESGEAIPIPPVSPKRRRKKPKRSKRQLQEKQLLQVESQTEQQPMEAILISAQKDEIEANLEKLFAFEEKEEDIFENTAEYGAQIQLVLSETAHKFTPEAAKSPNIHILKEKDPKDILRDSMWPCELRMRRRKLYDIMCAVGDESLRHYERVKTVFHDLFGADSDEEEAPLSPCDDMDTVTADSCKKRIAPMIVKHLMKPFKENLIANRWLFKKLAKRMADNIIMENDYPDERYIREFIDEYFCIHPTINDINDIV